MVREIWFCIENMHKLNRKPTQRDYHNNDDKHSNHPFLSDCFFPLLRFSEQDASNASELTTVFSFFFYFALFIKIYITFVEVSYKTKTKLK